MTLKRYCVTFFVKSMCEGCVDKVDLFLKGEMVQKVHLKLLSEEKCIMLKKSENNYLILKIKQYMFLVLMISLQRYTEWFGAGIPKLSLFRETSESVENFL